MSQDDSLDHAFQQLSPILIEGEEVLVAATQNSINSPLKKDTAVVTNRRFIIFRPKMFGRMDMRDFLWQDVDDVSIKAKLLGTTISVSGSKRKKTGAEVRFECSIDGLDKNQALSLYARAQEMEEQWREKNRARLIEEERARAGGVYVQAQQPVGASGVPAPLPSVEDRLKKLKGLFDSGLITDAEYEARKTQVVAEL